MILNELYYLYRLLTFTDKVLCNTVKNLYLFSQIRTKYYSKYYIRISRLGYIISFSWNTRIINIGLITKWVIAAAESFLLYNLVYIFRLKLDSQFNGKEIFQSFIQSWWNIALKCFQWFKQKRKLEEEQEGCKNVFFLFSIKWILLFCFWQIMIVLENEITKSGPK